MMNDEALARLAVAWQACELSDAARLAVAADDPAALAPAVLEAARRFSRAVAELTECREPPEAADSWWRSHPEEAAEDLDDWVIRHQDGEDPGPAPVSARLKQVAEGN
jgi:hypothetical protein